MARKKKANWLLSLPVAGLGIGCLLWLGYLLSGNRLGLEAATTGPSTPTPASVDIWDAYGQACAAAQAQMPDAQLVSASAHWHEVSEDALLEGASNWTFVFHSPASSHSLDVVANAGGARVVNQTQVWVAPTVMAEGAWQAGPMDTLLAFLACGGRAFLNEHPQAVVDLHLAGDGGDSPAWTVVALDPEDRSVLSLLVDAETGQVLPD